MILQLRDEVEEALNEALSANDCSTVDLGIERPPEDINAQFASAIAFRLAEEWESSPAVVAEELHTDIDNTGFEFLDSVVTHGPYLNFLANDYYYDEVLRATNNDDYGKLPDAETSIILEHTSANPTGPIHVGRARNTIFGDALVRLLRYAGFDVEAHYYVNNAGRQVVAFTWAYETLDESELPEQKRERIEYDLVRYYQQGTSILEEDTDRAVAAEEAIQSLMQGLEEGDKNAHARVNEVVDQVLAGIQESLLRLPAEFDQFVPETRFMKDGSTKKIIERLKELDEAEKQEGAWQLDLEKYGIEKAMVFTRSDGTSLYTTRDLAHHEWKLENADRALTVLGEDHKLQGQQLTKALSLLGHDADRVEQVHYSWVDLPEGTMSTREGTGVYLDDLLDESVKKAREEVESRLESDNQELAESEIREIAEMVGVGAVRFDLVSTQPTKGLTFRWEEALDFEAQSAPYIQYAHARCCGILDSVNEIPNSPTAEALSSNAERTLLNHLSRFPLVVETAAESYEPHKIASYAHDLAQAFNIFYRECQVLTSSEDIRTGRVALVNGSRIALRNALAILGIDAPRRM